LEIVSAYAIFPELCIMSFGPQGKRRAETYLYRKPQGGLNCAKLRWCDTLAAKVANQRIGLKEASMELFIIRQLGPVYPVWIKMLMHGVTTLSACAVFYHGGWLEMFISFILGLGVGMMCYLSSRYVSMGRMLEAIVSIAAAFLARLFVEYVYPACWSAITLSTVTWLLPGLSLTTGVNELAERKMISGTVRICFAMLVALELGFGLSIGALIWEDHAQFLETGGDDLCHPINEWMKIFFFFTRCVASNGLQEALPNQWPIMTFTATLSYSVSLAANWGGLRQQICTSLAAFSAGILVLVPGSVGVRGVKALMENDVVSGIQFGITMLTVALAIIVGLFVANMLLPMPRQVATAKKSWKSPSSSKTHQTVGQASFILAH